MLSFKQYHEQNPTIYKLFKRFAVQARNAGFKHYSARGIFHRMRWHMNVDTKDPDGFKINNNYSKDYTLMLIEEDPSFKGFFRTRNSFGWDE